MQIYLQLVLFLVDLIRCVHIRHLARQDVKLFGFGYNDDNDKDGLWPPVRNIALNAIVEANGTCGQQTKQLFCKLNDRQQPQQPPLEDMSDGSGRIRRRSQQFRKKRCSFCDVRSLDLAKNHLADYLIDGTNRWWQSTSLFYGNRFEHVTITLTFREVYHVAYVIVKAANAPRPGLWILERSRDGVVYEPWQYFARDDNECAARFGIVATPGKPVYRSDTDVICTSYYSKLYPLENGEIHVSLISGRPGQNRTSRDLVEFTKAHAIRFRLLGLRAQTEPINRWPNESFRRKTLYYAISEIIVGGQCACNGHALKADLNLTTGLCECDCQENRCGRNCDQCCPSLLDDSSTSDQRCETCLSGYYRDSGDGQCKKCDCGRYVRDECRSVCNFRNQDGTNDDNECLEEQQEGNCDCKKNGDCPKCEKGFFAILAPNREKSDPKQSSKKCVECFCLNSGNDDVNECQPLDATTNITSSQTVLDSLANWTISDLQHKLEIKPNFDTETKWLSIASLDLNEFNEFYYWKASQTFGGNRLHFYGSWFRFDTSWVVMRGDSDGKPVLGPSLLIRGGAHQQHFIQSANELFDDGNHRAQIQVRLVEHNFRNVFDNGAVTRHDLMRVLSNVSAIFLRAIYHSDQIESNLETVRWETGNADGLLEQCKCPVGFAGLWCEQCAYGYRGRHEFNQTMNRWLLNCDRCPCNGHSESCDNNATCVCEHSTIGDRCERCAHGFYGNPLLGQADDCRRCACPLPDPANNFSPNCQSDGSESGYVCTQCPVGYVGDHCELCDYGYYGDPTEAGSQCRRCDCNYNLDCDKRTGQCLDCPAGTTGSKCEQCARFYWRGGGGGGNQTCVPCDCYAAGSTSLECDTASGRCACKSNYTGMKCARCKDADASGIEIGCRTCRCHPIGAVSSRCDNLHGRCECRANVIGADCDRCADNHYALSPNGCEGCNCNVNGSVAAACDIVTGECRCKSERVRGRKCDRCETNYWDLERGCVRRCECNRTGSLDGCDTETGRCRCKNGVGGDRCDRCLPNYYRFGDRGCLSCENCTNRVGHVCDPVTGRCLCPANSYGSACQLCVSNTWGLRPLLGCQPCNCSRTGSVRQQCNRRTGQCECRTGYDGPHCDQCTFGYYRTDAVQCKPCACNTLGTRTEFCNASTALCSCDSRTGRCACKANVEGAKCDRCASDAFNATVDGCIKCFCFGRSPNCTNARFRWGQLRVNSSRELSLTYGDSFANEPQIEIISQSDPVSKTTATAAASRHRLIPGHYGNVHIGFNYILTEPFYWQLPHEFLGDRLLSYGGYLRFTLEQTGGENYDFANGRHPLVEITSSDANEIVQFLETNPSAEFNYEIDYEIRLHESSWTSRTSVASPLTRETFMTILQKVTSIVIKSSNAANFHKVRLSNVRMDSASLLSSAYTAVSPLVTTTAIELCQCPDEYTGVSCQNPNRGYYRVVTLESSVGEAWPCQCSNRSTSCDTETGYCLNCSGHTTGPHCDRCARGYYGVPDSGCRACECPSADENHAETCYWNEAGDEFLCKCLPGYRGRACTECVLGFYKNRTTNECRPCECDRYGSSDANSCDPETGRCQCKALAVAAVHGEQAIVGRRCDRCSSPMFYLEYGQCKRCDNCTRWLFEKIANISQRYDRKFDYDHLRKVVEPIRRFLMLKGQLIKSRDWIADRMDRETSLDRIRNDCERYESTIDEMLERAAAIEKNRLRLRKSFGKLEKTGNRYRKLISDLTNAKSWQMLDRFASQLSNQIDDSLDMLEQMQYRLRFENGAEYELKLRPLLAEAEHWQQNVGEYVAKVHERPEVKVYRALWSIGVQLSDFADNGTQVVSRLDRIDEMLRLLPPLRQSVAAKLRQLASFEREEREVLAKSFDFDAIRDRNADLITKAGTMSTNRTLDDRIEDLQVYEEVLDRVNYDYRKLFADQALDHLRRLERNASAISSAFNVTNGTIEMLEADNVYLEIVRNLNEAVEDLDRVQGLEHDQIIFLDRRHELSLPRKTLEFVRESESIRNETDAVLGKLNEVKHQKDRMEIEIGSIVDTIWSIGLIDNDIGTKLADLKNGSGARRRNVIELLQNYSRVLEDVRGTVKQTSDLANDINYKLKPKYVRMREFNDTVLSLADEKVAEAQSNLRMSNDVLAGLETMTYGQMSDEFAKVNGSLAASLQTVQDFVRQAKQTIAGIQVSIKSSVTGNCARTYRLPSHTGPTLANRIKLIFVYSTNHENGTLVFVSSGSNTTNGFLALDLIGRKPRFVWQLGGGNGGMVVSDYELSRQNETDHNYYEIVAERVGNRGRIRVRQKDDYVNEVVSDRTSVGDDRCLVFGDSVATSRVYVGDIPDDYRRVSTKKTVLPQLQQHPNLVGCVHELKVDGETIGLWNFEVTSAHCEACTLIGGWQSFTASNMYRFGGNGAYSIIDRDQIRPYKTNQFSVSLVFRTFDEHALLLVAFDARDRNRYVSIGLDNGRVRFRIVYDTATVLELTTVRKYNDGQLTKVMGVRVFDSRREEHARLTVNIEDLRDSLRSNRSWDRSPFPDLQNAKFYFGGLNPGFGTVGFAYRHFRGCLGEVLIDDFGYNLQDTNYAYGLSNDCGKDDVAELTVLGFDGRGYVEMEPKSLRETGAISLLFRTVQREAVLVECLDRNRTARYSLRLENDGRLWFRVVRDNGRAAAFALKSLTGLNDGRFHAVTVRKTGRGLELRVDDERHDRFAVEYRWQVLVDGDGASLFFGGRPDDNKTRLVGTIKDVIFDNELMDFGRLRRFENVEIGRDGPSLLVSMEPTSGGGGGEGSTSDLSEMESQTVSVSECDNDDDQFGYDTDAVRVRGPVELSLNFKRSVSLRNLSLEFDFRTFQANTEILLMNSSKSDKERSRRQNNNRLNGNSNNNNNNYLLVMIRDAKLTIAMKVQRRKKEISVSRYLVSDGTWHRCSLRNSKRKFSIAIDRNVVFVETTIARKWFPRPRFYVNGGGSNHGNFNGCLRNIRLQNKPVPLTDQQFGVKKCYANIENAVFFDKDAYAVQENFGMKNGRLEIEFEMRPMRDRGLLFYWHGGNCELVVEIVNGAVVVVVVGNTKRFEARMQFRKLTSTEANCDDDRRRGGRRRRRNNTRWFRISVQFTKDLLTLVTNDVSKSWLATNGSFIDDETPQLAAMFIGGIRRSMVVPEVETTIATKPINYYGCLRNLKINQQSHNWLEMDELHGLDLNDGCPI